MVFKKYSFNIIFVIILIKFNNHNHQVHAQCEWEYYNRTNVICRIRTLERQGLDLQGADGTNHLDIKCKETILVESQFGNGLFDRLHNLNELKLDSCKVLQLPDNVFHGLNSLRKLSIVTKNSEWGPGKSLELQNNSMNGLKELQDLDLSDNNIRGLPEGVLCPLSNLKVLNLTRNRIRSTENLGLVEQSCLGSIELQVLDLSENELRTIPENWGVSKLRRLQHLNLQENNISDVSSEALAGLNSLRILNLSHNHLENIPEGFLAGSKELQEIHLQNNELYDIPRGLFHRLEQLLVLDLSRNQLSSHHVDNGTFAGLIRLIVLNLSHNALTRIDFRTFKELYFLQILNLRNNSIGFIEENAFLPLYNLHTLNLAENRLHTLDNRLFKGLYVLSKLTLNNNLINIIEPNVFENCSDLKELDLSSNQLSEVPIALQDLSNLRTLDLGENQITRILNGSLKNLTQLTGLRMIDNQIENITKGMFYDLPRLSVLNLAKNRIQNIERGSFDKNVEIEAIRLDGNFVSDINGIFATLSTLLWLNLAENHLVWFDYAFIPSNLKWLDIHGNYIEALGNYYKLQEEIKVKTLDASHNRLSEIGPMSVPNSVELLFINNNHIKTIHANTFVDKVNLVRVDMYANQMTKLQLHQLRMAPVPPNKSLPELYLGGNPFECDCSLEWLSRLNNITSRQHPRIMDLPNIECILPHSRGAPSRPITTLKSKEFLCKYETHCFALCHCCDFDACDCEMTCPTNCTCYHDQTWGTNIVDCGNQQTSMFPRRMPMDSTEIYFDGNNFPDLQNHAFIGRKNLRVLFVNASNVITIQNRTFSGLPALRVLHLDHNKIQRLQGYEFETLSLLKELYLQNNLISYIANNSFAQLFSLEILRLDGNRLVTMPMWQVQLDQMAHLAMISLGRNAWSCRCKFLQELTGYVSENALIVQDSQDIFCIDASKNRELDFNTTSVCTDVFSDSSTMTHGIPNGYIPLVIAGLILLFLVITVIVITAFRESLKLWLFAHYDVRVFGPRCEETEKLYDAVLLHSAKDTDYVVHSIASDLESGRPTLRLCLQHRDLSEDATYLQILEAARASRRLVLILTRNFLQTEWSRCDLRRAVHDALQGRLQKLVIIEELETIAEAENDIELMPYLKTTTVNRIRRNDKHFWEKLRYALPNDAPYRGNNYTIDHHHERVKQPVNTSIVYRQAPPPAYCPDIDEANYSSAATATPSPRPQRRGQQQIVDPNLHRPPSEHIYLSIDSDYGAMECNDQMVSAGPDGVHRTMWRCANPLAGGVADAQYIPSHGNQSQSYLV